MTIHCVIYILVQMQGNVERLVCSYAIGHFRYIRIHNWLQALGNKTKETKYSSMNLEVIPFFIFRSLEARYKL